MKNVFIIVPSASLESPVRGACALANGLSDLSCVTLVSLKGKSDAYKLLNRKVTIKDLSCYKSWLRKIRVLKKMLIHHEGNQKAVTISIGLSADFINSWCSGEAVTCSSVRGDLPKVYRQTYG